MKTVLARRGFLGALAALPTVARASAEKAGITSQITNQAYGGSAMSSPAAFADNPGDIRKSILRILDPARKAKQLIEFRQGVSRLDADLAASRSLSLSAAIHIQAQRNYGRHINMEMGWLRERAESLGIDFGSLMP